MDKVALVTGGAQGIGHAIALRLASLGYRVAVADVRKAGFYFVRTDVSREAAARDSRSRWR